MSKARRPEIYGYVNMVKPDVAEVQGVCLEKAGMLPLGKEFERLEWRYL